MAGAGDSRHSMVAGFLRSHGETQIKQPPEMGGREKNGGADETRTRDLRRDRPKWADFGPLKFVSLGARPNDLTIRSAVLVALPEERERRVDP